MTNMLPPVDPDYLIEEDDPETLHGYARALLRQQRAIRAGAKADGYRGATVKAAACWLLDAYIDAKVSPCPELGQLFRELVRPSSKSGYPLPVRVTSREAYWEAITYEAAHEDATVYGIAKHLRKKALRGRSQKTAERMVKDWRKLDHYQQNLLFKRDPDAVLRSWARDGVTS